jgi:hypothetical protein
MFRAGLPEYEPTREDAAISTSVVACLDRRERTVLRTETVSELVKPVVIDPLHIMLGAGCGDWGMCLYLTIADAALIHSELGRLLAEHSARG